MVNIYVQCWICVQALQFQECNGLQIRGTTHINGPGGHIGVFNCNDTTISNIHISSPKDSHNTDGIDVSRSFRVNIHDCFIENGKDVVYLISTFLPLLVYIFLFPNWFCDFNLCVTRATLWYIGDDCVAIKGGSQFVNISQITCGPSDHGIRWLTICVVMFKLQPTCAQYIVDFSFFIN